jgi:flagellar protein FlbC
MLAQSALHETGGSSPSAEALMGSRSGSGSASKKAKGLAGLFSEILSQAQKGLGGKDAKSGLLDPSAKAKGTGKEAELRGSHAATQNSKAASGASLRSIAASKAEVKPEASKRAPEPAATAGLAAATKREASDKLAKSRESKAAPADHAEGQSLEASKLKSSEEKRRVKSKGDGQGGDLGYSLASLNAFSANAGQLKAKSGTAQESDSSINLAEGKKADRSSKPQVTVLDLRRQTDSKKGQAAKDAQASGEAGIASKDAIREIKASPDSGSTLVRELSVEARGTGESGSLTQARSDADLASGGKDFQSLLAERMRDQWNGEIVQSAHIVLRDGDAGTIRLRLKPESLGNVKIELNLSDNNISGKIVVESDEAKTAFEKNMNDLADAFKQGGFDSARLEVSVGSGSGGGAQSQGGRGDAPSDPFFSERLRSAVSSPADPATAASAYAHRGSSVDILA